MSAGGILRKIAARSEGLPAPGLERSILGNLSVLLNTRSGFCPQDPLYGVPDFTDLAHNLPAGVPSLQVMIRDAISRYEPRLRSVTVQSHELSPDTLTLSFVVRAELIQGGAFCFRTRVCHGGLIQLE